MYYTNNITPLSTNEHFKTPLAIGKCVTVEMIIKDKEKQ